MGSGVVGPVGVVALEDRMHERGRCVGGCGPGTAAASGAPPRVWGAFCRQLVDQHLLLGPARWGRRDGACQPINGAAGWHRHVDADRADRVVLRRSVGARQRGRQREGTCCSPVRGGSDRPAPHDERVASQQLNPPARRKRRAASPVSSAMNRCARSGSAAAVLVAAA